MLCLLRNTQFHYLGHKKRHCFLFWGRWVRYCCLTTVLGHFETLRIMLPFNVMSSETPAQISSWWPPTVGCPQQLYTRPPYLQLSDHGMCCLWGTSWSCVYNLCDLQSRKRLTHYHYNISVFRPACCDKERQLRIFLSCVRKQLNCDLEELLCLRIWLVE
jgi:hypothetical protein